MKENSIHDLYKHETSYWWHKGRRVVIDSMLKRFLEPRSALRILDVGCGTGMNLELLSKFGQVHGVDASPIAVHYCLQRGFSDVYEGRAEDLKFADESFDMVVAIELLEHVQEDVDTLREFARVLRPGGLLFLTVPAYQFLWTEHDEVLDHVRRYTLGELKKKLQEAGFRVEKGTYMVTFTSPLFVYRLFRHLFGKKNETPKTSYVPVPSFLNAIFVASFFLEATIVKYVSLPFGISVLCVARKVENPTLR
ncbi:MAG TPA: class I SAM-dependent methyltransferase [Candidatus Paceibacterota bacterium]